METKQIKKKKDKEGPNQREEIQEILPINSLIKLANKSI